MQGFGLSGSDLELFLAYDLQVFRFSANEVQLLSIPRTHSTLIYTSAMQGANYQDPASQRGPDGRSFAQSPVLVLGSRSAGSRV